MSFEIQQLNDILRVIALLTLSKGIPLSKSVLKNRVDRICANYACIDSRDLDETLREMTLEGLILGHGDSVQLTEAGIKLGREWRNLLLKREPVMELVAGLTDGSVTGLVVILSAFLAGLSTAAAVFAAFLTLAAVAITNFSSFLLGGITEDLSDMITLQNLMKYSLSDISDGQERDKSLLLVEQLFLILHRDISRTNLFAASVVVTTTFLSGFVPIVVYLTMPRPFDIILSLGIVTVVLGVFLVRYRSRKTKVHWKITLMETAAIVIISVIASLLLGRV